MRMHGHPLRSGLLLAMAVFASVTGGGSIGVAQVADTTPPETTITFGPTGHSGANWAAFTFTSSESASTFACSIDGGVYRVCSGTHGVYDLADGEHTFRVQATDAAGNTDPTPAERTWIIDTVVPDTEITSAPPSMARSAKATMKSASTDPGSTFRCSLDGREFTTCPSDKSYEYLGEGVHTFRVRAYDPAGNADPTPAEWTWTVDAFGPFMAIDQPTHGLWVNDQAVSSGGSSTIVVGSVTVQARAEDKEAGLESFGFFVDGIPVEPTAITSTGAIHRFTFVPTEAREYLIKATGTSKNGLSESIQIRVFGVPAD